MSSFYIASRLENAAQVKKMANILTAAGHTHTYDWTAHGSVEGESEDRIREIASGEIRGVLEAAVVIALLPGGRGTHTELGAAIALRKRILICAADEEALQQDGQACPFYWTQQTTHHFGDMADWLPAILSTLENQWERVPVVGAAT